MWFIRVKEQFHPVLYAIGHVLEPRMIDPMFSGVFG
jgi:hypothetical protein